jgi:putative membrane protein
MLLVRILVNALTLLIIAILPDIYFVEPTVLRVLFVALILGILNAFVKPIIQFLTLRFIFITYGFAIVIINAIILLLLNILLPGMFAVDSLLWGILGGAVMGLVAGFLENLLGLQIPILPEDFTPQPALAADPSLAFQTKITGEVMGPHEHLAAEVPLANESNEPEDAGDTTQQGEER